MTPYEYGLWTVIHPQIYLLGDDNVSPFSVSGHLNDKELMEWAGYYGVISYIYVESGEWLHPYQIKRNIGGIL